MAAAPLIDLDTIDLDKVVVSREQLYSVLKQANRFALVDGLLHFDLDGGMVVGYMDVKEDAWWATDHIPGRPLLPGALMVEASAQVCTYDFMHRRTDLNDKFVGFSGLENTRFRQSVEPGCRFLIVGTPVRVRSRMFTYRTQGFVDGKLVFESDIVGVVV
jgi:3-hydroxyacyl-[acyl-carrier-protein] dehydratase